MGSNWTMADVERLKQKGLKIVTKMSNDEQKASKDVTNLPNIERPQESPQVNLMKLILTDLSLNWEQEYQFLYDRKFRFDLAVPDKKIAIEYEGIKSKKSRHTTGEGFSRDCIKYNQATIEGWKVLRYSTFTFNEERFISDLKQILK